ncbi:peroxiredoxin [Paenisporosarcina sp. OV554]|uniref:peroxiredoxin family protein n=1 Tax=Paenisporosarcina sp. OV554 TaxID=2135694 RepID=UPI000D3CC5D6|nr:redoxin domain-containing protein [Paenisporosarcina sp. OV554]PUB17866.1 peroxiredoxin [Paenisporosarcina sp. OV554]
MKKKMFGLIIVAILISIMIVGFVKGNVDTEESFSNEQKGVDLLDVTSEEGLTKGNLAPDFTLTTLDGKKVQLSELKGKKVIVNFWATWCPPCKAEMPHMQNFYEDFSDEENVEILAVNLTSEDKEESVQNFVQDYGLTFPIPLDTEGVVGETFQAITIPTSYMIDTKGRIQNKIVGPMDENMIKDFVSNLD